MFRLAALVLATTLLFGFASCKRTVDAQESGTGDSPTAARNEQTAEVKSENGGQDSHWSQDLFGDKLVRRDKEKVPTTELADEKKIGVYFSAHWCPPCRAFTPKLVEAYNKMQKEGKPFEIVFVSFDKTVKAMYDYMSGEKMDWLAVPFDGPREDLAQKYGVRGIPALVILDENGDAITKTGRSDVMTHGAEAYGEW